MNEKKDIYIGPTVDSEEDVKWIKVASGKVSDEIPAWMKVESGEATR